MVTYMSGRTIAVRGIWRFELSRFSTDLNPREVQLSWVRRRRNWPSQVRGTFGRSLVMNRKFGSSDNGGATFKTQDEEGNVVEYLSRIPQNVPTGKIVVHNTVRPAKQLGMRGFRAWLADPSDGHQN